MLHCCVPFGHLICSDLNTKIVFEGLRGISQCSCSSCVVENMEWRKKIIFICSHWIWVEIFMEKLFSIDSDIKFVIHLRFILLYFFSIFIFILYIYWKPREQIYFGNALVDNLIRVLLIWREEKLNRWIFVFMFVIWFFFQLFSGCD